MASNALITVKEVVDGLMFKSKLPDGEEIRVKQLVLDGYKELNRVVLPNGRSQVLLTMSANYTVAMPDDMESLKDIYVPMDNGVWSLTRSLKIPIILSAGVIPTGWGDYGDISAQDGEYYSATGGRNTEGYYLEDYKNRLIIFRNTNRSEVLLDYNTSGVTDGGGTYLPSAAKGALEMYVMSQLCLFDILPINKASLYINEYEKQKSILRMQDFNFTAFMDTVYSTMTASVRR